MDRDVGRGPTDGQAFLRLLREGRLEPREVVVQRNDDICRLSKLDNNLATRSPRIEKFERPRGQLSGRLT
jgi:hypothetical protein